MQTPIQSAVVAVMLSPSRPFRFVSILVPWHEEPGALVEFLGSLTRHAGRWARQWEIIVVDYGRDSRRWNVCQQLEPAVRTRIRSFRIVNRRRLEHAVAFGHSKARGEAVLIARTGGGSIGLGPEAFTMTETATSRAGANGCGTCSLAFN